MEEQTKIAGSSQTIIWGALIGVALFIISRQNYLLFHTLAEGFSIVIACGVFIIAGNTRWLAANDYLLFLGIAYFFVSGLDLLHNLSYKGMGVFPEYDANLPTQLWIAGRYMEGLSLFVATFFVSRKLNIRYTFLLFTAAFVLLLGAIFYWHNFPTCFIEGVGLTSFKKISEYIISLILLGALVYLFRKRAAFDSGVFQLLISSIIFTIGAELAFTFYDSVFGLTNLAGHYLKITSFYLIYAAIIKTGLQEPYSLLFRNLKQKEQALRVSEEKYRGLFESALEMIHIVDAEGRIIDANQTGLKKMGFSQKEYIGKPVAEIIHPDFRDVTSEMFGRVIKGETIECYETALMSKKGDTVFVEVNAVPEMMGGKTVSVRAILRDITAHKKAEHALQEKQEQYRAVVNNTADYIVRYDSRFRCLYANPAALRVAGLSREQIVGKTHVEMGFQEELCELWKRNIKKVFETGEQQKIEFDVELAEGLRSLEFQLSPELLPDCSIKTVIGIARDVTERKRAGEKRKQLEMQLRHSQKMEAIGTLAAGIAHDFNNILNIIFGCVEYTKNIVTQGSQAYENMRLISKAGERAANLVKQILTFSRQTEQSKQPLTLQPQIKELVKSRQKITPKNIHIRLQLDPECGAIAADPVQIHQVITNLFVNATQAMQDRGGAMEIGLQEKLIPENLQDDSLMPGKYAHLWVSDTGHGMDEETVERIFDPYFTTKELKDGAGLGLAIVYGILQEHNASVKVRSTAGKGTTFNLFFPILAEKFANDRT